MSIPKRVADRLSSGLKGFQQILSAQKARDVSEADTVTVIKDVLSNLFGYDKYAELTSEHAIRGSYCDLAVKLDGKLAFLIEVKAIGLELKENHVKQAIDYAANQGCEWVVLTNGIVWRLFHVIFKKPVDKHEVAELDLLQCSMRTESDIEKLYVFTREGFTKSAMADYRDRKDATSRYMLAAIVLNSEPVLGAIRREIRRVSNIAVDDETIVKMFREQVIKREALDGEHAESAARRVNRVSASKKVESSSKVAPEGLTLNPPDQAASATKS
ncbi:MAG: type I restriction enzyme HsdR N-terminal domain-containing protein [Phycisphaerales bacterium]|jgi:hypothetical protein|nr:type I restriction enzyme HsdR N-terminal domain-containing protein [Phycisphaerales bacterium]